MGNFFFGPIGLGAHTQDASAIVELIGDEACLIPQADFEEVVPLLALPAPSDIPTS